MIEREDLKAINQQLNSPNINSEILETDQFLIEEKMLEELMKTIESVKFEGLIHLISNPLKAFLEKKRSKLHKKIIDSGFTFFKFIPDIATYNEFTILAHKVVGVLDSRSLEFQHNQQGDLVVDFKGHQLEVDKIKRQAIVDDKDRNIINYWANLEIKIKRLEYLLITMETYELEKTLPQADFNFHVLTELVNIFLGLEVSEMQEVVLGPRISAKKFNLDNKQIEARDLWLYFIYQMVRIVVRLYSSTLHTDNYLLTIMSKTSLETYKRLRNSLVKYTDIIQIWSPEMNSDIDSKFVYTLQAQVGRYYNAISSYSPLRKMDIDTDFYRVFAKSLPIIQEILLTKFSQSNYKNTVKVIEKTKPNLAVNAATNFNNLLSLEPTTLSAAIRSLKESILESPDLIEVIRTINPESSQNSNQILQNSAKDEQEELIQILKTAEETIYSRYQNLDPKSPIFKDIQQRFNAGIYACTTLFRTHEKTIKALVLQPKEEYKLGTPEADFLKLIALQVDYPLYTKKEKFNGANKPPIIHIVPSPLFKPVFAPFILRSFEQLEMLGPNTQQVVETPKEMPDKILFDEMFQVPEKSLYELRLLKNGHSHIKDKILETLEHIKEAGSIEGYIHLAYSSTPNYYKRGAHKLHNLEKKGVKHIAFKFPGSGMRLVLIEENKGENTPIYQVYIGDYHDHIHTVDSKH